MLGMTRIPKPKLGATLIRTNHDGANEEALVVGRTTWSNGSWRALVLTESGWDHVTDALEFRSAGEWRPTDWVLEPTINAFHPPDVRWDNEVDAWVPVTDSVKVKVKTPDAGVRPPAPAQG